MKEPITKQIDIPSSLYQIFDLDVERYPHRTQGIIFYYPIIIRYIMDNNPDLYFYQIKNIFTQWKKNITEKYSIVEFKRISNYYNEYPHLIRNYYNL